MQKQGDSFGWQLGSYISLQHLTSSRESKSAEDKDSYWPEALKQISQRCALLEQEKQQLTKEIFEKEDALKHLQRQIDSSACLHRQKQKSWVETITNLKAENAELNKQISELLDVIKLSKDEVAELKDKLAEIVAENQQIKQSIGGNSAVQEELESYKKENAQLASELKRIKFKQKRSFDGESSWFSGRENQGAFTARERNNSGEKRVEQRLSLGKSLNKKDLRIPLKLFIDNAFTVQKHEEIPLSETKRLNEKERKTILDRLRCFRKTQQCNQDKNQFLWTLRGMK